MKVRALAMTASAVHVFALMIAISASVDNF
jgi:hypothetical protein